MFQVLGRLRSLFGEDLVLSVLKQSVHSNVMVVPALLLLLLLMLLLSSLSSSSLLLLFLLLVHGKVIMYCG
jgi:hypothetical protein